MKKKKINNNENEWKDVLQNSTNFKSVLPEGHIPISRFVSVKIPSNFSQTSESNISTENFTTTQTKGNDYDVDYCNVGVNKDWDNKFFESLKKLSEEINYKLPIKKDKRIEFECNLKFWQLFPSVAINLHCNEIELTWMCFGMYINFK